MSAILAVQVAIRARLVETPAVVALVPATAILDRHQRPAPDPSIILGEAQEIDEGADLQRRQVRVWHTLHIWKREASLEGANAIAGAIRMAVAAARPVLGAGWHCADMHVSSSQAMRDPDGESSHGIVTVVALVQRTGS